MTGSSSHPKSALDETLTDLQILGRELHKNAFGGRALPGPAGGAIALPQAVIRDWEEEERKERVGDSTEGRKGKEGKDVKS